MPNSTAVAPRMWGTCKDGACERKMASFDTRIDELSSRKEQPTGITVLWLRSAMGYGKTRRRKACLTNRNCRKSNCGVQRALLHARNSLNHVASVHCARKMGIFQAYVFPARLVHVFPAHARTVLVFSVLSIVLVPGLCLCVCFKAGGVR